MKNGVFWIIEGKVLAYPFGSVESVEGIAKSGNTYNHKRLWEEIKPAGMNKPYNYYPRGRVVISSRGNPTIYMNPNIENSYVEEMKKIFELTIEPRVVYDNSEHYKCHLDN